MKIHNEKADENNANNKDLLYYFEKGMIVFTELFHLKRGYCCKSGCRHCPWKNNKKTPKLDSN